MSPYSVGITMPGPTIKARPARGRVTVSSDGRSKLLTWVRTNVPRQAASTVAPTRGLNRGTGSGCSLSSLTRAVSPV